MLASAPTLSAPDASALRLSIVIPTLDEEAALRRNLPAARALSDELIVSDGGSGDATQAVAAELGAKVVSGPAGRGGQLNRGAAAANGDVLVFLHADTRLPEGSAAAIRRAIAGGAVGGAFYLRFDSDRRAQRLGAWLINLRTRWLRAPLGDQVQFATAEVFDLLGGFRDWPILEDLDFIRRLKREGRIAILPGPAVTAARRFLGNGVARTVATNWLIWILFAFGVSPARLARLYRHVR
jgi:rSAM/selenodomain-associated transferase 2